MVRAALVLIVLLAVTSPTPGQPKVGDPAPELAVAAYVAAPADGPGSLQDLRGKVVVLEFWATWCAPCIAAIPHLNALAEELANEPIVFIALTSEAPELVERFLQRRPIRAWVGIDQERQTAQSYGVRFLPHTVVIGLDGRIVAITSPESLSLEALQDAAAGKPLNLPLKVDRPAEVDWDEKLGLGPEDVDSLGHIVLRRSAATGGATRFLPRSGHIQGDGLVWQVLVQLAYGVEPSQVSGDVPELAGQLFRLSVLAPDRRDESARRLLRDLLPAALGIAVEETEQPRRVMVLTRLEGDVAPARPGDEPGVSMARSGSITMGRGSMETLAQMLGGFATRSLGVDETGLEGEFAVALEWTPGDQDSLDEALAAIGLRMSVQMRPVRVLQVRAAAQQAGVD